MRLTRLDIRDVRLVRDASLAPGPGFNVLLGPNGAGKTSVLEAVHLLAHGRSFRGRVRDGLVRTGAPALEVFARWADANGLSRQVGLRHAGDQWEGRLDGVATAQLSELCSALAAITFEPGSHVLLEGGGEPRRRFLDWGLFHVEPTFLVDWRRQNRALRQRNALLKQLRPDPGLLDAWDAELAESGMLITRQRQFGLDALRPHVETWTQRVLPELGAITLEYSQGWKLDLPLDDALLLSRSRDLVSGFTSVGPHRADWRLGFAERLAGESLSRGQTKLAALAVLLAQAELYASRRGAWPLILLDDLASELDAGHRAQVLQALATTNAQILITGTEAGPLLLPNGVDARVFHVEHGSIQPETSENQG